MLNYCANGPSGYTLSNSLRFRQSASAYLNRTPASAGNRTTWTWSGWVKLGVFANNPFFAADSSASAYEYFRVNGSGNIQWGIYTSGTIGSFTTNAVYRDPSAWYHVVIARSGNVNTCYVNGVQQTFSANTTTTSNGYINATNRHTLGANIQDAQYYDGYMAEVNFIDGQALTPSSFGSTNSTTGVWQPAKYTGTYGTNGFYLPFSSSNSSGFSSYYGNFNGSNQYLTFTGNTGLQFGTGDFTVEYWMYQTSVPSQVTILDLRGTPTTAPGTFGMFNNSIIYYNGTSNISTSGFTPTANTWVHVAFSRASGVMKIFANGIQYYSGSETTNFNTGTSTVYVGRGSDAAGYYMPGYVSNLRVVKGTALYTANFTPPSAPLTAVSGTQLLMLQNATFVDNSSNAFAITNNNSTTSVSGTVGSYATFNRDASGNNNSWGMSNINYTTSTATTYDLMTDVPTLTSATAANYCVLNPLAKFTTTGTFSNANLSFSGPNDLNWYAGKSTIAVSSGKWYCEAVVSASTSTNNACGIVTVPDTNPKIGQSSTSYGYYGTNGNKLNNNSGGGAGVSYGATWGLNDIIGIALDLDAGTLTFYKNNVSQGTAFTGISGEYTFAVACNPNTMSINFGQRPFTYTPPTGYVALNTYNLPTSTIVQGNKYMDAKTYTGTGATQSITNGGFYPDFTWIKSRSNATNNDLFTAVLSGDNYLKSNSTDGVVATTNAITSFNSNGFTLGSDSNSIGVNINTNTYAAWQWLANGNSGTTINTNGSITSYINANTSSGFSQVYWTGTAANGTLGHGLGVAPKFIITKCRGASTDWGVYHASLTSASYYLLLNSTAAQTSNATYWNSTAPTSSVFSVGSSNPTNAATAMVAFCWAEIAGFSKFGSYTGNGSADGPFIYTGFRPKFILLKSTTTAGSNWWIYDTARSTFNAADSLLFPNLNIAEYSGGVAVDILSNGFKFRNFSNDGNKSGDTFIYAAFAENPFKNSLAR